MSVTITKPISGIRIEGQEIDIRPKEPFEGTYEAPTLLNLKIAVENPPENYHQKTLDLQGKPLSGRVWMDKESRTSAKAVHHKPDDKEAAYRKARTMQIRDFNHQRKKEITDKVPVSEADKASEGAAHRGEEAQSEERRERQHLPSGSLASPDKRHEEAQEVEQEGAQAAHEDAQRHVRGVPDDHEAERVAREQSN